MSAETLFTLLNSIALVAWLLIAIFPRRPLVVQTIAGAAIPAFFAVTYIVVIASAWGGSEGSFSSLQGVAALFANPWLLLAGWTHYLAFDLLVGVWEVRDSSARGMPHVMVLPCLLLTFLFGPAGWLLYLVLRRVRSQS
jgi:hypothetical protein